ncbi:hypothetical protein PF003_g10136 [Phytophthora fragariae]|nr:hypothetical protein PF003_g10136 [Phytophthora fragariae]
MSTLEYSFTSEVSALTCLMEPTTSWPLFLPATYSMTRFTRTRDPGT